jgi:hypothetical protein
MAGPVVEVIFAGDAGKLLQAGKQAEKATDDVASSVTSASQALNDGATASSNFNDKVGKLGAGVEGMSGAVDNAGAAVQAFADLQQAGAEKSSRMNRALIEVRQAQEDYSQAIRDGNQAVIDADQAELDLEQARLDQATALRDYNEAVKEHGAKSSEAMQAQIDLKQAGIDVKQAQEDSAQAIRDGSQASIDATLATQDLADAQRGANPPDMQKWADQITMVTPILSGLIGVVGIVTAVQWAWNAAQWASPTTWIIAGILILIGVIVLIATKTDWFQRAWRNSWKWIKDAAKNTWEWIKWMGGAIGTVFSNVANFITAPFRAAFNGIAYAWNNTIGRLSWTVPGWVPGIGGNSIGAPDLPYFHSGISSVPGAPGTEMLAMLQAGERVTPAYANNGETTEIVIRSGGTALDDVLVEILAGAIQRRGGNVQAVLGRG